VSGEPRLCGICELVLDILGNPDIGAFIRDGGEVAIGVEEKRIL
jgi:hypothetical protein